MTESTQTYHMLTTHRFDAPVEQVWNAWRDSDQVKQWWGPTGFTAPVADIDFREGGTSLVCMRTPDGHDMYNTWTYQKIVPLQEIEFVQHFSDQYGNHLNPSDIGLPPDIPSEVHHTITFHPIRDRQTEMTVTEYGYPNEQIVELSKAGMDQCLDKMAALFTHS